MPVSNRLKTIRQRKGISQAALSRMCGISQSAIGYIENGQRSPTEQTIRLLADALGVTPSDLIEDSAQQKEPAQMSRQELINDIDRKFSQLPDDLKRQALAYIAGRLAERQSK